CEIIQASIPHIVLVGKTAGQPSFGLRSAGRASIINGDVSRTADVAAKRRESTENHVFRMTILRREKFTFQCGYQ
ncbi:MAG: hypothetical protein LBM00_07525, partial [Deltaproteobacteria bacterium]|nr:hypothetical protein [Deltaproteobacteria bacterium]